MPPCSTGDRFKAFLVKAGAWPLNFWLPAAYGNTVPPVGAIFAILTKVGVYALLRIGVLLQESGVARHNFGGTWLFCGLIHDGDRHPRRARRKLDRLAAFLVVSSGTSPPPSASPARCSAGPGDLLPDQLGAW